MKYFFFILVLFLSTIFLQGQNSLPRKHKKAIKHFKKAESEFYNQHYYLSEKLAKKALKYNELFLDAYILLANIKEDQGNTKEAINYYQKTISINKVKYPEINLRLADLYLKQSSYNEAQACLEIFLGIQNTKDKDVEIAKKLLSDCKFYSQTFNNPHNIELIPLGENINTENDEFVNAISTDDSTLIFTRKTKTDNESFYFSEKTDSGWNSPQLFPVPLGGFERAGAITISPDGKNTLFAGLHPEQGFGRYDIFISEKKDGKWQKPVNGFQNINTKNWESQPSFSSDGRTLFFASNRVGGFGGSDIWLSQTDSSGMFQNAINLGANVNTKLQDGTPFLHHDGQTLFFSSKGHQNLGKTDLFVSRKVGQNEWSNPENLGYPINTKEDEINIIVAANGVDAYLSKFNIKSKSIDIFRFLLPEKFRPKQVSYVKGIIYDKKTKKLLKASLVLTDLHNNKEIIHTFSDETNGKYILCLPIDRDYALSVFKNNYLFHSEHFSLSDSLDVHNSHRLDIALQVIRKDESIVLNNVFFDTDKSILKKESFVELNTLIELLSNNPALCIEISGHTDNTGTYTYNQLLSERRAKAVFEYIVSKGIVEKRLLYKGYGSSNPVAENKTEKGRLLNRRTEFKVVSF